MAAEPGAGRRLLIAHPSPDVYGSDLQLVQSVRGLVEHGWRPTVVLPTDGPLRPLLEEEGAQVRVTAFPVLRRALLRPRALLGLLLGVPGTVWRLRRLLRTSGTHVVYVNTLTIPLWLVAARAARLPVLCHSHEAERLGRPATLALTAPLLLADVVVANSAATREVLTGSVARLARRVVVVHNGVPDPGAPRPPRERAPGEGLRLVLVSRLSPRKGVHVALAALALLRDQGTGATLDVCGTPFPGYEWYERALLDQVDDLGLRGAVTFHGYVAPTTPLLEAADVVLVPSFGESFGNVAVEGMLAGRPVVASAVQGLTEVLEHGRSGVLVEPGSAPALAEAVAALAADPALAVRLARGGRDRAVSHFGVDRYRARIASLVAELTGTPVSAAAAGGASAVSRPSRR